MYTVRTGARLHFGFQNLSLAHDRLYGGVGVGLAEPRIVLEIEQSGSIQCEDGAVRPFVEDVVAFLGVEGAKVRVQERFERHVGLGSGTQLALAVLVGIASAYDVTVDARSCAPELGRGGRSGVGVATFEAGGFVIDAGHPTERFTSRPPRAGTWDVPRPVVRHTLPESWRFVLVTPQGPTGNHGDTETRSMQSVVERADPGTADEIAALLLRRLLPAAVDGDLGTFGSAVARLGRRNGAWYADEQGGVYRPPAGQLVEALEASNAVAGAGQSSWGPTVYAVTSVSRAEEAVEAGTDALAAADVEGTVRLVSPRPTGATVTEE